MTTYTAEDYKRSRRIAFVLGSAVVISILFLIYAFAEKEEAQKQRLLVESTRKEAAVKSTFYLEQQRIKDSTILALRHEINLLKESK